MNESIKGYIIMGCFGRFFSKEESSYSCELCGTHWTEAKIDGFESLKNFALSESIGEVLYDVSEDGEFNKVYEDDKDWLISTYKSIVNEVLGDYDISYDDFYQISFEYWNRRLVK